MNDAKNDATLRRVISHPEMGMIGTLTGKRTKTLASSGSFFTLERPWKKNAFRVSCIPPGEYLCKMRKSPKFGWRYELKETEPRTHILIHPGNKVQDTLGCILLGQDWRQDFGDEGEDRFWLDRSRMAVEAFEEYMNKEPFMLTIINDFDESKLDEFREESDERL